jgi:excisionase family DNA binding protein
MKKERLVMRLTSPDRLLTIDEAARFLQIAPGTLRHWIGARRIDYVRVGGKLTRIKQSVLDQYIEEHTAKAIPR